MRDVVAGRAAVHLTQGTDDVSRVSSGDRNWALDHRRRHLDQIGRFNSGSFEVQGRIAGRLAAKRVEVSGKVAAAADGARDMRKARECGRYPVDRR